MPVQVTQDLRSPHLSILGTVPRFYSVFNESLNPQMTHLAFQRQKSSSERVTRRKDGWKSHGSSTTTRNTWLATYMTAEIQSALVAFLVTSAALPVVIFFLRRWTILDNPSGRSSHHSPTIRGAGAAQIVGIFSSWGSLGWISSWGVLGPITFGVLGLIDDIKSQRPLVRLMVQLMIGIATVSIFVSELRYTISLLVFVVVGSIFVVVVVNATNFMDGINGISALHGVLLGATYWIMLTETSPVWSAIAAALVGVSLAFLPWNWGSKARAFLGDSGSYLLGALYAVLVIAAWKVGISPLIAVAPLVIYLIDVSRTIALRIMGRRPLFIAHREHIYQELTDGGLSHSSVSLIVGFFTIMASGLAIAADRELVRMPFVVLLLGILSLLYISLPRILGTRCSTR